MRNRFLLVILVAIVVIAFLSGGCAVTDQAEPAAEVAEPVEEEPVEPAETKADNGETETVFTLEELADYDGQDGRPAYISVEGVVYDVTGVPPWSGGTHFGFEAGVDVTEALQSAAPHGAGQLAQAEIVGTLAE